MYRLLIPTLVLLVGATAYAGGSPDIRIYIDFDPPNYAHSITLAPYQTFTAYVCLDRAPGGIVCVSFRLTDLEEESPGVIAAPSWVQLLPGGLAPDSNPWWDAVPRSRGWGPR